MGRSTCGKHRGCFSEGRCFLGHHPLCFEPCGWPAKRELPQPHADHDLRLHGQQRHIFSKIQKSYKHSVSFSCRGQQVTITAGQRSIRESCPSDSSLEAARTKKGPLRRAAQFGRKRPRRATTPKR